ncbi:MAG: DUF3737 family protein, partial [Clostridia bacterium]|nr:DUF3737 family protein [Clostridia bacterium]
MDVIKDRLFEGERAEFWAQGKRYEGCTFRNGESPLKESRDISLDGCTFGWKYPLWYAHRILVERSTLLETARSGIWYTRDITIRDSLIEAPKTFRRAEGITLERVKMPNAKETLWGCKDVNLQDVK